MKTNRPKSVTHVSKSPAIPRDFDNIPELSLEKSLGIGYPSLEPELQSEALKKRAKMLGLNPNSTKPAFGLEE